MKFYSDQFLKSAVAEDMKRRCRVGAYDPTPRPGNPSAYYDRKNKQYLHHCTGLHRPTGSLMIFTRDTGHHRCGWWKNPDYESCFHLSLSYRDPETLAPLEFKDNALTREWLEYFFGPWQRYLWIESPKSDEGKILQVWHYRVFTDPAWQPIIPRGEVYSRELTEAGWKSFSEVNADHEQWDLQGAE
jgi:hypothetical protein